MSWVFTKPAGLATSEINLAKENFTGSTIKKKTQKRNKPTPPLSPPPPKKKNPQIFLMNDKAVFTPTVSSFNQTKFTGKKHFVQFHSGKRHFVQF